MNLGFVMQILDSLLRIKIFQAIPCSVLGTIVSLVACRSCVGYCAGSELAWEIGAMHFSQGAA